MVGQAEGGFVAMLVLVFGKNGHESLRECAFGEQPSQQVGNAKGNEEGIGINRRAEGAGHQKLADEASDA